MGLFSVILKNGTELSLKLISLEFEPILIEGEVVEKAFRMDKDIWIFTNKRLIMVNKIGIRGSKVECLTLPYNSILKFSKETTGLFNKQGELKVWLQGVEKPICKACNGEVNITDIYLELGKYTLQNYMAPGLVNTSIMAATLTPSAGSRD